MNSVFFIKNIILIVLMSLVAGVVISCNNDKSIRRKREGSLNTSNESNATDSFRTTNYNIYVENSRSIDGYVNDADNSSTEFKETLQYIISDLATNSISDSTRLFFVNEKLCQQLPNKPSPDLIYFIKSLRPEVLQKNCPASSSLLPNVIDQCLNDTNSVNLLISDCVFSESSHPSLASAQAAMGIFLADKLKRRSFSTAIFKYYSKFNGNYYLASTTKVGDFINKSNIIRPYYLMIFGKNKDLNFLFSKIDFTKYSKFSNSYFLNDSAKDIPSTVSLKYKKGNYEIQKPATNCIINNARANENNLFQFSIDVDFRNFKGQESFLMNPANFRVTENYKISSITTIPNPTTSYTHNLTLLTSELRPQQRVEIALKYTPPQWVDSTTTEDDKSPSSEIQQQQTYGFKYLAGGIADAYKGKKGEDTQFKTSVTVNQSEDRQKSFGNFSFLKVFIFFIAALMIVIIWLKNKK